MNESYEAGQEFWDGYKTIEDAKQESKKYENPQDFIKAFTEYQTQYNEALYDMYVLS
jgi:hypothetical protein